MGGQRRSRTARRPGDDVFDEISSYGWATSKDPGSVFSNGFTTAELARGPLTIKKVEPVLRGDAIPKTVTCQQEDEDGPVPL